MANDGDRLQRDTERYRKAAELGVEQLEWCIGYLHRIGRSRIAEALTRNRREIIRRHRL